MGLITQRGKIVVSFFLDGKRIKEYTGLPATAANKKECADKLKKVTHLIKAGAFDAEQYANFFPNSPRFKSLFKTNTSDQTVGQYLEIWHQQRCPLRPDGTAKPDHPLHIRTWQHDGGTINLFKRTIGHHKLTELTSLHIKALRAELELTRSGTTVVKILHVLSGALREAVKDKLITESPMPELKRPKKKLLPRRKFTAEERDGILGTLPEHLVLEDGAYITRSTLHDLYSFWFLVGWRDSEVTGLKFIDLDHPRREINVRRAWSPRPNPVNPTVIGFEDKPKTGEREVPLSWAPHLFEMFRRREREALATGKREFVFSDSRGRAISYEVLARRIWAPALRQLGISTDDTVSSRTTAQYAIRHTAISCMVDAGFPIQIIEKVTGTSRERIYENYLNTDPTLDPNIGQNYLTRMTEKVSAELSASEPESAEGGA